MATIKLGNTKQASRAINYAEKRAVVRSGYNCDVDYAKSSFKAVRGLYGKEEGIQAHLVIQSFKPGEVTPEQANEIGLELAKKIAPEHQVTVYTHDDTAHVHNHIVINSVNQQTGNKYQSNRSQMMLIKEQSNELCQARGLSTIDFLKKAEISYTLAEKAIIKRDGVSWKDELREVIEEAKESAKDKKEFVEKLETFGIKFKETNKTVSYLHPEQKKFVRGKTLGSLYDKEALENVFESNRERSKWDEFDRDSEERRTRRIEATKRTAEKENAGVGRDPGIKKSKNRQINHGSVRDDYEFER
ncbi:relaxase/mobilization nuclease domain-containing protein [Macrococcus equipercicus]|uniref:Relaxase/mobilization nuclease domain-containing protein n=1 Tax=Macrococcus equipercicus TaxID=69967 RepID=A0ABQ6R630_9STAP|nr:relaxase/mobilization nuclease domain-containing protein [Macrococcus equipercicus]